MYTVAKTRKLEQELENIYTFIRKKKCEQTYRTTPGQHHLHFVSSSSSSTTIPVGCGVGVIPESP